MYHIFEKLVGLFCFFFVVIDFIDLFFCTTILPPPSMTEYESKKEPKRLEEAKKKLQKIASEFKKNESNLNILQDNTNTTTIEESHKDLPPMVPLAWLSPQEAQFLGYKKSINHENAINRIRFNEPLINFTISTTRKDKPSYFSSLVIRVENPLIRFKIAFYNVLLVSLSHMPIFVALIILTLESSFILYTMYTVCRYRYLENWFTIASRINTSVVILALNFVAIIIAFT